MTCNWKVNWTETRENYARWKPAVRVGQQALAHWRFCLRGLGEIFFFGHYLLFGVIFAV